MKTVPFSDILASTCQLVGLDRNTLNDKSFSAIRDLTGRRITTVWDREEWPDTERTLRTFPGNPIQSVLTMSTVNGIMTLRMALETQAFPRVYLTEFSGNAYAKNTIGKSTLAIVNPFFITSDGTSSMPENQANSFTYLTASDSFGDYITSVDIQVKSGTYNYPTYKGPNHPLTAKLVFDGNLNLLVMLQDGALQGLSAFSSDPRNTSRTSFENFLVEDFNDRNDVLSGGLSINQEYSYLRFFSYSEKFITYRKSCIRLFGSAWESHTQYSAGSQTFYDPYQETSSFNPTLIGKVIKGDFWDAIVTTDQGVPPANSSYNWSIVEIPYRFKDYLINGVCADFLRSEGRAEEANLFDQLAEAAVQQQIDVLIRQQGQVKRMDMVYTY